MKKSRSIFLFYSLLALAVLASAAWKQQALQPVWNPDAGYIPSYTEGATITATSNQADAWKVLDGDPNTHWQSGGVVPGKPDGLSENVTIDFGQVRPVGQIHSRHWAGEAGTATATQIYLSTDGQQWQNIVALDPTALHTVVTILPKEITARYLRLVHTLVARDWNKAYIWEVKAYDRFGPYGQKPTPVQGHTTIREMLGVNGYWSFGTDQYSDLLAPDGGPFRFKPVASHLRNYHDMTWDLKSPNDPIDFEKMSKGGGTPATEWLNWDREQGLARRRWHERAGELAILPLQGNGLEKP
ncbi:MAG: discoidin domain-containing protein [Saprospiraceae bacterium]|nr:discoidin domain-containing protein [Saprospiraceae bacterium]